MTKSNRRSIIKRRSCDDDDDDDNNYNEKKKKDKKKMKTTLSQPRKSRMVFPDVLMKSLHYDGDDNDEEQDDISSVFFELANMEEVAYRCSKNDDLLIFQQDVSACGQHTGGIIWETSYLLLLYLLKQYNCHKNKQQEGKQQQPVLPFFGNVVVELGAGVGFLGQCLSSECYIPTMILTETEQVLINLKSNLERQQQKNNNNSKCHAIVLDWTKYKQDIINSKYLKKGCADTILSTDVIFTSELVIPLLQTASYICKQDTVWYLCVQIRCITSHEKFIQYASKYNFYIQDITNDAFVDDDLSWGNDMECYLYKITRLTV